ncbi:MAG TPA: streptomycin biosynthesis protein StrI [Planctomycetaceae bacterium]|nr:streptomycin biosynthesis protein StrI [Planctomycetaceae bacterium]
MNENPVSASSSRRAFFKKSGILVAGTTLAASLARTVHAAEDNTIKVALVGCGKRGTGAAVNALATKGPTRLVAMADAFAVRVNSSHGQLAKRFGDQMEVPDESRFVGLDAYRKAIDVVGPGGVVILATPPAFRPLHLEYAVEKGCHVFMEKSFAVDAPGARRVLAAGKIADEKNLKIVGGLMTRHCRPVIEAIRRIHDGEIGEIISASAYRMHGPAPYPTPRDGASELAHQIRNPNCYTWLFGSFMLDWLIHSLDVACWAKQAWPISAQGQGGRQVRKEPDQMFDHYAVEYTFPDGTLLMAQGRHMNGCYQARSVPVHGTRGSAILGENYQKTALYRGYLQTRDQVTWRYRGPALNAYQVEHDHLFHAIRHDEPCNETERSVNATIAGILGRMAAHSGQRVTWDEAAASNAELAPGLDQMTMDSDPPVKPDENGNYPIDIPGITKAY